MTDYEKDNDRLMDNCIKIIEAERKELKRKPSKNSVACGNVRAKIDDMKLNSLTKSTNESELEALFKTL